MLLAVAPLFFAWRSLPSYFACAAFPMFILLVSRGNMNKGSQPSRTPAPGEPPVEIVPEEHKEEKVLLTGALA